MSESELQSKIDAVNKDTELTAEQKSRQIELLKLREELAGENAKLSGKGLRWFAGMTRGKGSQVIKWQAFDESLPESLPADPKEFADISGISGTKAITQLLIDGFNEKAYADASDPVSEYVNPAWPVELKTAFRISVRTMAKGLEQPIDEIVDVVKAGFDKKFASSQAKS